MPARAKKGSLAELQRIPEPHHHDLLWCLRVSSISFRPTQGPCGVDSLYCFMGLVSLIAVRPSELASDRGKLVFDKTPPATIDRYNRSKLFLAWDGDRSILRSFRLSCWFEPYPHVINSIMQEQEADPN